MVCPDFNDLVNEHWFIYLWETFKLSQDRFLACLKGILIANIYGLTLLYLLTYFIYFKHKGDTITLTATVNTFDSAKALKNWTNKISS